MIYLSNTHMGAEDPEGEGGGQVHSRGPPVTQGRIQNLTKGALTILSSPPFTSLPPHLLPHPFPSKRWRDVRSSSGNFLKFYIAIGEF